MDGPKYRRGRLLELILPLVACLLLSTCSPVKPRPNILLIVIDTLRADHLGTYGYPRPTSPVLDGLAEQGVLFEQASSSAPWTLPSVMSILTGRLPSSHRVENDGVMLSSDIPLLAQAMQTAGYRTAAVMSHIYVSRAYGFERGFDEFEDFGLSVNYEFEAGMEPNAARVSDRALAQVDALDGSPSFLVVHYFDPHWDYAAPAPFGSRFVASYQGDLTGNYQSFSKYANPSLELSALDRQHLLDLYDGEIAYTDFEIGRLLDGLRERNWLQQSVVIVTADHGEEFKEHGSMGHGRSLYDEVSRVPLVMVDFRFPKIGRRVGDQVQTVDIFPSLCEVAGIPINEKVQGRSFLALAAGEAVPKRGAISETIRFDAYRKSYRTLEQKLIVNLESNRREIYDLAKDPEEKRNIWAQQPEKALQMEQELFARVDVLSGGWNLRWASDGTPRRFSGWVETEGIFSEVIPLFSETNRHHVTRGKRLDFDLEGVTGGGGFAFRLEPADARVRFSLAVDGKESPEWVKIGAKRNRPPSNPLELGGGEMRGDLNRRPTFRVGEELGYFLWKNAPQDPENWVELEETLRERLRSLGYVE